MKIDVHAACYPKAYLDELKKMGIGGEGGIGVDIPAWTTAEERIADLDRLGIDVQVLGLSAAIGVRLVSIYGYGYRLERTGGG